VNCCRIEGDAADLSSQSGRCCTTRPRPGQARRARRRPGCVQTAGRRAKHRTTAALAGNGFGDRTQASQCAGREALAARPVSSPRPPRRAEPSGRTGSVRSSARAARASRRSAPVIGRPAQARAVRSAPIQAGRREARSGQVGEQPDAPPVRSGHRGIRFLTPLNASERARSTGRNQSARWRGASAAKSPSAEGPARGTAASASQSAA